MSKAGSDRPMTVKIVPDGSGRLVLLDGAGRVEILDNHDAVDRLFAEVMPISCDEWVKHWLDRNWRDSLHYHLATLDCVYEDVSDSEGCIRSEILSAYRQQSELPPRVLSPGKDVPLPRSGVEVQGRLLGDLFVSRRTTRKFSGESAPLDFVSRILWEGLGEVRAFRERKSTEGLNALRSFGVAFDFYVGIYRVSNLEPGLYTLNITDHALSLISTGDLSKEFEVLLQSQGNISRSCLTLFFVCDLEQYMWRYRHERALRNLFLEVGRIAQRLIIAGENQGLRSFMTPACSDKQLSEVLKLDVIRQYPLYSLTFGFARK